MYININMQLNKISLAQKILRSKLNDQEIKEMDMIKKSNRQVLSYHKTKSKLSNKKHEPFYKKSMKDDY